MVQETTKLVEEDKPKREIIRKVEKKAAAAEKTVLKVKKAHAERLVHAKYLRAVSITICRQ